MVGSRLAGVGSVRGAAVASRRDTGGPTPANLGGVSGERASTGFWFGDPLGQPEQVEDAPERRLRLTLFGQQGMRPPLARAAQHDEPVGLDGRGNGVEAVEKAAGLGHRLGVGPLQGVCAVGPGDEPAPRPRGASPALATPESCRSRPPHGDDEANGRVRHGRHQRSPTTSPPALLPMAINTVWLVEYEMNRTDPSPIDAFTPPECQLRLVSACAAGASASVAATAKPAMLAPPRIFVLILFI